MRGYARVASVGFLMMGLLAVPSLSPATDRDGNGRHSLLSSELRSKIEHLRDKMAQHRERHHNQGDSATSVAALRDEVTNLRNALAEMARNEAALLLIINNRLNTLETPQPSGGSTNPTLTELAKYVKVEPGELNGVRGPHVVFTGVNLHLRSGRNATNDGGALSGLGNLIVGYNEMQSTPVVYDGVGCDRTLTGSHNIVTGSGNLFTSYGGVVVGSNHCITSPNSSILAGDTNEAHGPNSAILGGTRRGTFGPALNLTVPTIR